MKSAIYWGSIRHRRFETKSRQFRHPVTYFFLDLAEIPKLFSHPWFFSDRGPSLFGFRRKAYLGPTELPLDEAVRRRVETESGRRPKGPIGMLTQITSFGHTFNPVTFYYCFDESGDRVTDIIAEITNTPWDERHSYVLSAGDSLNFEFDKKFHVSPFLGMDYRYRWAFSEPGSFLTAHLENYKSGAAKAAFDATLTLKRSPWTGWNLFLALLRRPMGSLVTLFLIYIHAAVIWLRRIPYVQHPKNLSSEGKTL
jgi:DUF1365 family protein